METMSSNREEAERRARRVTIVIDRPKWDTLFKWLNNENRCNLKERK